MTDLLLTELERQRKYIELLPADFKFPLFNAKKALESQRRSGYRDSAAAAREIVDNAIEAGARQVVLFSLVDSGQLQARFRIHGTVALARRWRR